MICPSCSESLHDTSKYCVHCGIAITRRSVQMAKIINNCGWVARRALGGLFAGAIGWILSIAVSRTIAFSATGPLAFREMLDLFPGQSPLSTAIAGCFIGTAGGMIERSVYKTFLGGLLGMIGGLLGGFAYPLLENIFKGHLYSYSFAIAGVWGIVGAMIGLSSGILEATKNKISVGILGGIAGGILGGGIGSQMYGAMLMEMGGIEKFSWVMGRFIELASGGIVGVNLWLFLGFAEKLYIFRRRQLLGAEKKVCDFCHAENVLKAWYCTQCGSALQVAASRDQITVTPFRGLERVSNAFQYLSWLSATAGVITTVVVFISFLIQNFLFALFGSLLVSLVVYMVTIGFKALSDTVKLGMQVTEKLTRESIVPK